MELRCCWLKLHDKIFNWQLISGLERRKKYLKQKDKKREISEIDAVPPD